MQLFCQHFLISTKRKSWHWCLKELGGLCQHVSVIIVWLKGQSSLCREPLLLIPPKEANFKITGSKENADYQIFSLSFVFVFFNTICINIFYIWWHSAFLHIFSFWIIFHCVCSSSGFSQGLMNFVLSINIFYVLCCPNCEALVTLDIFFKLSILRSLTTKMYTSTATVASVVSLPPSVCRCKW